MKHKIGDKVKILIGESGAMDEYLQHKGEIGEIVDYYNQQQYEVHFSKGIPCYYEESEVELAPSFEIGDKVVLACSCHQGRVGTIVGITHLSGRPMDDLAYTVFVNGFNVPCREKLLRPYKPIDEGCYPMREFGHPMFYGLLKKMGELHSAKNKDYAQGGDALGNFKRVAAIKKLYPNFPWDTPAGTSIDYMLKQLDCAMWMLSQGYEGEIEGFEARMLDVSNYSLLSIINKKEEIEER